MNIKKTNKPKVCRFQKYAWKLTPSGWIDNSLRVLTNDYVEIPAKLMKDAIQESVTIHESMKGDVQALRITIGNKSWLVKSNRF